MFRSSLRSMLPGVRAAARAHHDAAGMAHAVVRKPAPAFSATAVINEKFETVKLADYKGSWLVLFFYPLDFTFVCPTEITAFSDRVDEFHAIGTKVAAVSVDSAFSHLAWVQTPRNKGGLGKMRIPILADITKDISRDYGVLIEDRADGDAGVALRGTFIIDPAGILRSVQVNDLPVGRSVDEALRIVQAFQYHAKHGEVCPAGWTPGKKTMKPDSVKSQEYFSQLK